MPDNEVRARFRSALNGHLADATELVWLMQNALTEQNGAGDLAELEQRAYALRERANVILGHVVRWSLLEEEGL